MSRDFSPFKTLVILASAAVLSALVLGFIYTASEDRIRENRERRIRESVYRVLPEIDMYEKVESEPVVYEGRLKGETVGFAVKAEGMGFQGQITVMVGFKPSGEEITGLDILESVETPGLGARIYEEEFTGQFKELQIPKEREIEVEAITGATISSEAVKKIVNRAIKDAENIY